MRLQQQSPVQWYPKPDIYLLDLQDVIKTRMQVQSQTSADRYRNIMDAISRMLREEGVRAFGKGMTARILWIAPNTAITIALCKHFLMSADYGR